jgi:hypothetical protein
MTKSHYKICDQETSHSRVSPSVFHCTLKSGFLLVLTRLNVLVTDMVHFRVTVLYFISLNMTVLMRSHHSNFIRQTTMFRQLFWRNQNIFPPHKFKGYMLVLSCQGTAKRENDNVFIITFHEKLSIYH